jgi:hypothetical protein
MNAVTPRWEWRSFGQRFGPAEKRLAALPPQGVQESDEIYLLSAGGGNVKTPRARAGRSRPPGQASLGTYTAAMPTDIDLSCSLRSLPALHWRLDTARLMRA